MRSRRGREGAKGRAQGGVLTRRDREPGREGTGRRWVEVGGKLGWGWVEGLTVKDSPGPALSITRRGCGSGAGITGAGRD